MNISSKEKIMLCILGIILVCFGYYNFIYTPLINKVQQLQVEEEKREQEYNDAMETINSLEDRRSDVKILKSKVTECSKEFYPVLSEEHIIVELDNLMNDSGLKGGISFESIVSESVQSQARENASIAESTMQAIAEKYSNTDDDNYKEAVQTSSDEDMSSQDNDSETSKNDSSNNAEQNDTDSNKNTENKKENTVHNLKCTVNFQGTYEELAKFLKSVEDHDKKIVINAITMGQDSLNGINGTIKFEMYAVPKIDDEIEKYLEWNFNNTYGKATPFSTGAATGVEQNKKETDDFVMAVKSINSDLPTVILGRGNDDTRVTYVYADRNAVENVEIELTQQGSKYYYKYRTSKENYPKQYNGYGAQFVPSSEENISLNILSENRFNSDDKSGVNIKITNNTDKLLKVNINGDDTSNPRVTVDGDSSKINVNKK